MGMALKRVRNLQILDSSYTKTSLQAVHMLPMRLSSPPNLRRTDADRDGGRQATRMILPTCNHNREIAPMRFKLSVIAAGILTTMVILPGAALASCINGICVSGHDEGNVHVIDFSTTLQHVTHFNFNGGSGQRELGPNETQVTIPIPQSRPTFLHFAFQGCSGGGLLQKSRCSPWANFSHTVQ
jgi:hypothetical protein